MVEARVCDQRLQGTQRGATRRTPRRQIRELPPPQGLGDMAVAIVGEAVQQVRGAGREDRRELITGDAAIGVERIDDLHVSVHWLQQESKRLPTSAAVTLPT